MSEPQAPTEAQRIRLAVLGSPIAHSKSPAIHRAAYAVLGLDWSYQAVEVSAQALAEFVRSRDASWRGLSLTMPLKRDILPLLAERESLVEVVGGANTVLFTPEGLRGFNTDVYGVVRSFREAGVGSLGEVQVLGAGATAASVIAGVAQLGAGRVLVSARSPQKAQPLITLGRALGTEVVVRPWETQDGAADAIVNTVPGAAAPLRFPGQRFSEQTRSTAVLFDVVYDPWPSPLAQDWMQVGGTVISGLELLVNQAIAQVRIFVGGDPQLPVEREAEVVAAMRAALG